MDVDNALRWPSYRYHPTKPPVIVNTAEEEAALEDGYRVDPYTPEEQAAAAAQAPSSLPPHSSGSMQDVPNPPDDAPIPARRR